MKTNLIWMKHLIEKVLPISKQLQARFIYRKIIGSLDPEMSYVINLLKKRRRFIDVGANVGIYTYFFSKHFESIDAFEPLEEICYRISKLDRKHIATHNVALSNKGGSLTFYIPIINGSPNAPLASLERRMAPFETRQVMVKKLDDYNFDDVDLIKIDVEGHEDSVIEGAEQTIKRTKPLIIVEIEQRHISKPINEVFAQIENIGYDGYYLSNNNLISIDQFSYEKNQLPYEGKSGHPLYINNFIFVSK